MVYYAEGKYGKYRNEPALRIRLFYVEVETKTHIALYPRMDLNDIPAGGVKLTRRRQLQRK